MKNLIASLFFFCSFCYCAEDKSIAQAFLSSASALEANGELLRSETLYCSAFYHDENCGEALLGLGRLSERRGRGSEASAFYARAEPLLPASKRVECTRAIARLNPYVARIRTALAEYDMGLERLSTTQPLMLVPITQRRAMLGITHKPLFRGVPLADVIFQEDMGYEVAEVDAKPSAHVGQDDYYTNMPREWLGLKYTKIVPGQMQPVYVKFKTDGAMIVLFNKNFIKTERENLERFATKIDMPPIANKDEKYDAYLLRGLVGQKFKLIFYVLVAGGLEKGSAR